MNAKQRFTILTLLAILLIPAGSAFAQSEADAIQAIRAQIGADRQALIAANLRLTEAESQNFWPLYREFHTKIDGLADRRLAILINFRDNFDTLDDEVSEQIIKDYFKLQQDLIKLKKQYAKKMNKVIPAKKTLRYFQMENKMDAIIDFEMTKIVPLAE